MVNFVNSYRSSRSSISSNLASPSHRWLQAHEFGAGDMHESPSIHKGFTYGGTK